MDNTYNKDRENVRQDLVSLPGKLKPDPVSLAQQAKYKQQGLTVTSNNTSIIPRDSAGNIILQENSETNPLLIIEPVTTKITTNSILRVIETRFQYYSFPASIIPIASAAVDFNIDLNLADADPIFARYKPSENWPIATIDSYDYTSASGILMDEIEAGNLQKNTNTYYITKEIKNSGKDLRFRVKINHRSDARNSELTATTQTSQEGGGSVTVTQNIETQTTAQTFFTILKQGPNFDLDRNFKPGYVEDAPWHSRPLFYVHGNPIQNVNIIEQPKTLDTSSPANIFQYNVYSTEIDVIIRNSEFEIGDNFGIGACGKYGPQSINSEQTYWVITDASKNVDEWNQEI